MSKGSAAMPAEATAETLATLFGVSTRTIRDLATRGIAVRGSRGRYLLVESSQRYCEQLREAAAARAGGDGAGTLTEERTREARARAEGLELRNAQLRGELAPTGDFERRWSAVLQGVRARLLAVPTRAQQTLPHLSAHDVAAIDREVRDALTEIGEGAEIS